MPPRLLAASGKNGAIRVPGEVGLLSGEGEIAKSALALSIACRVAGTGSDTAPLFDTEHGTVLFVSFEDALGVISWRLKVLASHPGSGVDTSVRGRIALLDLKGCPIFGPSVDQGGGSYNARPVPLAGWWDLWTAVREMDPRPKLIVIDPALCAYVGDANAPAPVREFLHSLSAEARETGAGVLLVAHSTKAAGGNSTKHADAYDAGQVGGSGAWADGSRGVLTMTWQAADTTEGGSRRRFRCVAVVKANHGTSRIWTAAMPIRVPESCGTHAGHVVGFRIGPAGWQHGVPDAEIVAGEAPAAEATDGSEFD